MLLPLHLMLIVSLFEPDDYVAETAGRFPWAAGWAGKLALPIYLLQVLNLTCYRHVYSWSVYF